MSFPCNIPREANDVLYVFTLARNSRLIDYLAAALFRAWLKACSSGGHARTFTEFEYQTRDSWSTDEPKTQAPNYEFGPHTVDQGCRNQRMEYAG